MTMLRSLTADEKSQISDALSAHGVGQTPVIPFPSIPCPVCHEGSILRYRYLQPRGTTGKAMYGYVWCSGCMRYAGFVGAVPTEWKLKDVLTPAEHEKYDRDGIEGLERMLRHVATRQGGIA